MKREAGAVLWFKLLLLLLCVTQQSFACRHLFYISSKLKGNILHSVMFIRRNHIVLVLKRNRNFFFRMKNVFNRGMLLDLRVWWDLKTHVLF